MGCKGVAAMKISFAASPTQNAKEAQVALEKRYGACASEDADFLVTVGGDGMVLKALHAMARREDGRRIPIFAMRKTGSVGFLCNEYAVEDLPERLGRAQKVALNPLKAIARTVGGADFEAIAINEVTALRDSHQSVKLKVFVDGVERLADYSGDGLLLATPAGSTAYNHSAGGPIMPLDANTLVMTAICGFRPRRWSYAVLPQDSTVEIRVMEPEKRPVRIEAGSSEARNVATAKIWRDKSAQLQILFDPSQHLGERIVREQFMM